MLGKNSSREVCQTHCLAGDVAKYFVVDDHPQGYPQLAAFQNSDENFLVCRQYGFLRNRVLLYRQDELSELEKTLIEMDQEDKETSPKRLRSRRTDELLEEGKNAQPIHTRKGLIQAIDDKLKEYGKSFGLPTIDAANVAD